jgi:hypothetical protein
MDKPDQNFHPIGFIDTLAPEKIDAHARCVIDQFTMQHVINREGFKEHIVHDLAHQIARLIEEQMDVFWRTLDNGDTEVEASVRILNEGQWRDLEAKLFDDSFTYYRYKYQEAWQSKQKLLQTQCGSIRRESPIVLPHCN